MVVLKSWDISIYREKYIGLQGQVEEHTKFRNGDYIYTTQIRKIEVYDEYLIAITENTVYRLNFKDAVLKINIGYKRCNEVLLSINIGEAIELLNVKKFISIKIEEIFEFINKNKGDCSEFINKLLKEYKELKAKTESEDREGRVIDNGSYDVILYKLINSYINKKKKLLNILNDREVFLVMNNRKNDKVIEAIGKVDEKIIYMDAFIHLGMFTDTVLIMNNNCDGGILGFYLYPNEVSFYKYEGIENIIIKNVGQDSLNIKLKNQIYTYKSNESKRITVNLNN